MRALFSKYIDEFKNINSVCKKYLCLYMLQAISAGVGFFIAIYLEVHLMLPPHIIGYIVSLYVAGNFLGSLISAKILDTTNPIKFSRASLMAQSLCFACLCITSSISTISIAMFFLGVFSYMFTIANNYFIPIASGESEEGRARSISLLSVSSNIGVGIGGALVSLLSKGHPNLLFAIIASVLFISSLAYIAPELKLSFTVHKKINRTKVKSNNQNYILSLFVIFMLGLIFAQKRVSYSLFLENFFGENGASSIFMLNSLLIIFFLPPVTAYFKKFDTRVVIGVGSVLLGGGLFFLQYTQLFVLALLVCIVTTFGEMLGSVFSQLMCFQSSPSEKKGRAMGFYKLLYALGTFIGSGIGGNIQEYYGTKVVWEFCGLIGAITLVVCLLSSRSPVKSPVLTS